MFKKFFFFLQCLGLTYIALFCFLISKKANGRLLTDMVDQACQAHVQSPVIEHMTMAALVQCCTH